MSKTCNLSFTKYISWRLKKKRKSAKATKHTNHTTKPAVKQKPSALNQSSQKMTKKSHTSPQSSQHTTSHQILYDQPPNNQPPLSLRAPGAHMHRWTDELHLDQTGCTAERGRSFKATCFIVFSVSSLHIFHSCWFSLLQIFFSTIFLCNLQMLTDLNDVGKNYLFI